MWEALLGGLVGGALALAGAMLIEVHRVHRALRGAGRIAAAEMNFNAAQVELFYEADADERSRANGPGSKRKERPASATATIVFDGNTLVDGAANVPFPAPFIRVDTEK